MYVLGFTHHLSQLNLWLAFKLYKYMFFTIKSHCQSIIGRVITQIWTFHWYLAKQYNQVNKMMCEWRRQGHSCLYGAERITLCLPSVAHCSVAQNLFWLDSHDIIRVKALSHWLKVMSCFRGRINGAWTPPLAPCDWQSSAWQQIHFFFVYSLHNLAVFACLRKVILYCSFQRTVNAGHM